MNTLTMRRIVKIDADKCDGCGLCVPSCAEGAIRIIDGKATLAADNLCDGLGNCLGQCPRDAISIEERPAEEFDERAVHQHLHAGQSSPAQPMAHAAADSPHGHACPGMAVRSPGPAQPVVAATPDLPCGCPGTMARQLRPAASADSPAAAQAPAGPESTGAVSSRLRHWPVQLTLVPERGPMWNHAHVLLAADCASFAMGDFHSRLLAGRSLAIACPKLDDVEPYVQKLARVFAANSIESVTVAHMEVPCCLGLMRVARAAMELAGREDLPIREITIGVDGTIR